MNMDVMEEVSLGESPENVGSSEALEKVAENPYDYDAHAAYIAHLRSSGGASEDIQQAREIFHSFFPFSEGCSPCCGHYQLL